MYQIHIEAAAESLHDHVEAGTANTDTTFREMFMPTNLDEDLTNRLAKAFARAVELCDGGDKDPFKRSWFEARVLAGRRLKMRMIRQLLAGLLLVLLAAKAWTPVASAANADYIYCAIRDTTHSAVYYSDVFLGDYSDHVKYQNAFSGHVKYSGVIGLAGCLFPKSSQESRAKQDGDRATDRRLYKQLIDTGWTY